MNKEEILLTVLKYICVVYLFHAALQFQYISPIYEDLCYYVHTTLTETSLLLMHDVEISSW